MAGGGVMGKVQNDYMQAWHNIRWVFQPGKGYRYWHKDQAQLDQWNKEYDGWRRNKDLVFGLTCLTLALFLYLAQMIWR
jgi:hypothetical protein